MNKPTQPFLLKLDHFSYQFFKLHVSGWIVKGCKNVNTGCIKNLVYKAVFRKCCYT